jgi:sec-independent protein translocase protein TatA
MLLGEITPEVILIVILIAVVVFGGSRIPKIARGLGSAKSEFEKGLKEGGSETKESASGTDAKSDTPDSTDKPAS